MAFKEVIVAEKLPNEKMEGINFLYIVIDSDLRIHYELNNKGHIVLPIHFSEINPFKIYKNLPRNLVNKCVSEKSNIVGVLQLWIYYTKDYTYARVKALGILKEFNRNRVKALFKLCKAMDNFCLHNGIKFVEAETSVFPEKVMKRIGFNIVKSKSVFHRLAQLVSRQTPYVKTYFE